jgi:hypothetical protein
MKIDDHGMLSTTVDFPGRRINHNPGLKWSYTENQNHVLHAVTVSQKHHRLSGRSEETSAPQSFQMTDDGQN